MKEGAQLHLIRVWAVEKTLDVEALKEAADGVGGKVVGRHDKNYREGYVKTSQSSPLLMGKRIITMNQSLGLSNNILRIGRGA